MKLLVACGVLVSLGGLVSAQTDTDLRRRVVALEATVAILEKRVKESEDRSWEAFAKAGHLEHGGATLSPTETAFARMDSESGIFLIAIEDASPYLDGIKIKVRIAPLTYARYVGFSLGVLWGETVYPRRHTYYFPTELRPGMWNSAEVVLIATRPGSIGKLIFSITPESLAPGTGR